VTFAAVLAGPPYVAAAATDVERQFERGEQDVVLPPAAAGWSGPAAAAQAWKPLYEGARIERSGRYADAQGAVVDAYVAVYGLGTSAGAEMISYRNRIYDEEHRSLGRSHGRSARLPTGGRVPVQDLQVDDDRGRYRVWYWFMVGERPMTSPYQVKAQEGLAFLARHAVTERIVVLATPVGPGDEQRLAAFVAAHAACVRSGFDAGCLR
jgi:EpsI family protein